LPLSAGDSNVLLAVQLKRDGRAHAAGLSGRDIPENFAFVCGERSQMTITEGLKNNVARRSDRSTTDTSSALRAPLLLLRDDVPCNEP
jgi:hypothetical protein